ncbi:hypothetical protein [Ornithinimicrobium cryptoxanthini]|uniref:Lipoprotein n=1 Tax=Ornithinimicrobium cryptoxanthini TaxID=2934161 RepID=A0ABY4YG66_9MICO|nr:hypothetical protein [Ornithinimicrobium cryptoxanthini]USQ75659.1 hypothetical protein NF557_13715 [Ornithinimicrobium cryptoxanthini]
MAPATNSRPAAYCDPLQPALIIEDLPTRLPRTAVLLAASLALAACGNSDQSPGAAAPPVAQETPLVVAAADCGDVGEIADEGHTLFFDTEGEEDTTGDSPFDVACVLLALDTPSAVIRHMDTTRALDGTQTDEWGDLHARWTYHPNVGMNLTITVRD